SRSLLVFGFFVPPVSAFASALVFACLLVCLIAIASFSKSAPRLSRCLHHHEPSARARRGGDHGGRPSTPTAMLALTAKSSGMSAGGNYTELVRLSEFFSFKIALSRR